MKILKVSGGTFRIEYILKFLAEFDAFEADENKMPACKRRNF